MVAAQAARRLGVSLFIGEAALDALEVVLAFACLALGGVDTAVGRLVVQPRRGDLDAGVDLVVEAEVFVDIRRGDLAGRDGADDGRRAGDAVAAGHRRHDIGAQLNYPIPVLIERVDEDDAQIQCVDGNLHRKDIPISELARAAQMKMDALKRKAGRRSKADILAGKEPMKRSDEQVGEALGMSRASVQRLMRVNQLEEPLKKMVDKKELPLDTAEQISHMKPTEQKTLADAIEKEGGKVPSKTEAVKLKEESRAGTLTAQKIENSVAPTKREIDPPLKVTFQDDELRPYFPDKGTTVATVKRTMFEAMDLRKKALERQKMKMQTEKEPKKKSEPER